MNYGRWVMISQGSGIIGVLTTITLAFVIGNVWALVIGFTVESAVRLLLSFLVCPYLPGFSFDRESLRALFKFARGMLGLPIMTFIYKRADVFVIAKLCSAAELGLYSMAIALVIPLEGIISIMGKIVLPAFSKNQTEKDWINRATLHITSVIAYFCFPLLFFVTFYGKDLLYIAYGPQYAQVSGAFAIIFASWMMRTCGNPIVQVYWAMGRPELNRLFTGLRALLIIIMIFPAVKWFGLIGAASASLISMVVAYFFQVLWLRRLTQVNLLQYGLIFIRAFGISLCILLVWFSTRNLSLPVPFLDLFPGAIGCLLAYGLGISLFLRYWKKAKIFLPPHAK